MKLLIDGYNVIPAIPDLGRLLRRDLEEGREAFLERLRAYKRLKGGSHAFTVVFDGKSSHADGKPRRAGGIEVIFSRNETADDLILRLLRGAKRGAVLVTSDRALGQAARETAGEVIRSGEFAGRLEQALLMEETEKTGEAEAKPPARRLTTKKKGNPRRLPKRERQRSRRLRKL